MGKRLTQDEFVTRCKKIHGDKYDYSLVVYKGAKEKVKIICPLHGTFEQLPRVHDHQKSGCYICHHGGTQDAFIRKAINIHNDTYDYSLVEYKNNHEKVKIICKTHGIFLQSPDKHIMGRRCPKCSSNGYKPTTAEFIVKAIKLHGNRYNYTKTKYMGSENKLIIICKKHGEFLQTPRAHIKGCGCQKCKQSKGENVIEKWLIENKLLYVKQKKFPGCKYKNLLQFDFYLEDYNMCIEFDGAQHTSGWWKASTPQDKLEDIKRKDEIKNNFCISNHIRLLRIPFTNIKDVPTILECNLT